MAEIRRERALPSAWRGGEEALITHYEGKKLRRPAVVRLKVNGLRTYNGVERTWYVTSATPLGDIRSDDDPQRWFTTVPDADLRNLDGSTRVDEQFATFMQNVMRPVEVSD